MREAFKRLSAAIDKSDVLAGMGVILVFYGVRQIYPPLADILAGVAMIGAAFITAKEEKAR